MSESNKEKWMAWISLTTTILAVCAAISSLRASSYSTKVQLTNTKEASSWAYFQSKSIKQHTCETMHDVMQANLLAATSAKSREYLENKLKIYQADIVRYDQEKNQIKTEAEQFAKQQDIFKKHGASFGLAVILLQIAIMLSSMGALLKRQLLWFLGLGFGLWGIFNMLNGFFLFI
ncbi:DUF4337 domain-containing protein [candidate division TA06 bacterium]|nr:DUF4337 domain-containing protein [candidate division TA06 bacterium]